MFNSDLEIIVTFIILMIGVVVISSNFIFFNNNVFLSSLGILLSAGSLSYVFVRMNT